MSAQRLNCVVKFRYFQQFATGTKTQSGTANPRPQSRPAADEMGWERDRLLDPSREDISYMVTFAEGGGAGTGKAQL